MSPSFNSFGSIPSVSQLNWDTDLIIPDGKAIESAGGEVEIDGDVSVSGGMSIAGHQLNVMTRAVSKSIVIGDNTLPVVYSDGAKITGSVTLTNDAANPLTLSLKFYARDATGSSKLLHTLDCMVSGNTTNTYGVDVAVPVGTAGLQVTKAGSTTVEVTSTNMTVSNYTTSFVF